LEMLLTKMADKYLNLIILKIMKFPKFYHLQSSI